MSAYGTCGHHLPTLACIMSVFRKEEFNLRYPVADVYSSVVYSAFAYFSFCIFVFIHLVSSANR